MFPAGTCDSFLCFLLNYRVRLRAASPPRETSRGPSAAGSVPPLEGDLCLTGVHPAPHLCVPSASCWMSILMSVSLTVCLKAIPSPSACRAPRGGGGAAEAGGGGSGGGGPPSRGPAHPHSHPDAGCEASGAPGRPSGRWGAGGGPGPEASATVRATQAEELRLLRIQSNPASKACAVLEATELFGINFIGS